MTDFDDAEPQSLNESHWQAQPRWMRIITPVIGIPVAIAWVYLLQSGKAFEHQELAVALFVVVGVLALLQLIFIARAYWRMDI